MEEVVSSKSPGSTENCEICHNSVGTRIDCAHLFCTKCLSEYMQAELKQGAVTLKCPSDGCEKLLEPNICKTIVWSTVYNKWSMAQGSRNFDAVLPASTDHGNPCGICQNNKGRRISCSHTFCKECLSQYVQNELQNSVAVSLKCPEDGCDEVLELSDCKANVRLSVYSQWRVAVKRCRHGVHTTNQDQYQQFSKVAPPSNLFYCNICMKNVPNATGFTVNPCSHKFCTECVTQHLEIKVSENVANIHCPEPTCKGGVFEPDRCRELLKPEIFDHWTAIRTEPVIESKRCNCPFQDCSALLTEENDQHASKPVTKRRRLYFGIPCRCAVKKKEIPEAMMCKCPHCNRKFCVHCRVPWHDSLLCDEYLAVKEREDFLKLQRLACSRSFLPVTAK